jgi:hypothetical protein
MHREVASEDAALTSESANRAQPTHGEKDDPPVGEPLMRAAVRDRAAAAEANCTLLPRADQKLRWQHPCSPMLAAILEGIGVLWSGGFPTGKGGHDDDCPLCGQRIHVWHTCQFDQAQADALVVTTRLVGGVAHLGVARVHAGDPELLGEQMSHYCNGVEQPDALAERAM